LLQLQHASGNQRFDNLSSGKLMIRTMLVFQLATPATCRDFL